jgi:hypothetical protein
MRFVRGYPIPLTVLAVLSMCGSSSPTDADPIVQGAEHCVVNVTPEDSLNLRAGPGTRHPVLTRLPYGRCGLIVTGPCRGHSHPIEDGHYAGWWLQCGDWTLDCGSGISYASKRDGPDLYTVPLEVRLSCA